MLFSVVLCVNKKIPFLSDSINSILNQSYTGNFEFIIVANNCDDNLYEYLKSFKDRRIKLYRTKIGQLSFNLNYALDLACGEYIVRMDADDVSLPERLEVTQSLIFDYKPDVIGFLANYIDKDGAIIGETNDYSGKNVRRLLLIKNPFVHPTVAIKKDTLLLVGGYLGGRQSEDYDLWIRLAKLKNTSFMISPLKVLNYRLTAEQSRGNVLPYCEVSSYFLREFLISWHPKYLVAMFCTVFKRIIIPTKNR